MFRKPNLAAVLALALGASSAVAQDRRSRIDVEQVTVEADVSPNTQSLSAKATVRFTPVDDNITSASFELNNALNVSRVVDQSGKQVPASRNQQDFTVRLSFDQPLPKGQPVTITFYYDGKLTGQEDSPVYGIKFAAIHPDYAFLMYPARWFPVSGYTSDRFAAVMRITVPMGYSVVGSGLDSKDVKGDKNAYEIKFERASFPGSIAIVKGQPAKVASEGVTTTLYFRDTEASMAQPYGDQVGKLVSYFTGLYGLPPYANLTVIETEDGAPNGYAAPGLIFLAPKAIGKQPNSSLLANQISRQWFEELVSPATRNHLWLTNGLAAYSELIWAEHEKGPAAMDSQLHNVMVESLTVDTVPVIQSARLDDYSPELWALTGSKGAAVLSMLRYVVGDDNFFKALKAYAQEYPWKSANTDDFRKVFEKVAGQDLGYFFIQWIESSGAPEFKLEYTIYRTQKGFRVMGKIAQDLDTFRMPVNLKIETEGNPEEKRVEVVGTSSEFSVDTFGKPKNVIIDPGNKVLRYSSQVRVAVAIRRGEQYMELSEFSEALKEYQKALESNRMSSLAHYRIAEVYFLQNNYQMAANSFRDAISGDLDPKWTEVWSHINLGHIFDITGQRERAVNEYNLALRTKDDTQGAQEEAGKYLKTPYERQKRAEQ
ncbi:MAG TPA: M1 family aminopeptidase [Candidatus Acidoferrales bacterium]|nr:M1 family aminopeptidase [Candidatus Acidoferrales bacterium]